MNFRIVLFFVIITFLLSSCSSPEPLPEGTISYNNAGELVGPDLALCACCGGHIFNQDDSNVDFRIIEFPSDFQSTLDTINFPKPINLNYTEINTCGPYTYIRVDNLEVQ